MNSDIRKSQLKEVQFRVTITFPTKTSHKACNTTEWNHQKNQSVRSTQKYPKITKLMMDKVSMIPDK